MADINTDCGYAEQVKGIVARVNKRQGATSMRDIEGALAMFCANFIVCSWALVPPVAHQLEREFFRH